jgi:hypothetical protein
MAAAIAASKASAEDTKREQKWMAEDDLRTLMRAAEIQKDKARLARAKALAKEQLASLQAAAK